MALKVGPLGPGKLVSVTSRIWWVLEQLEGRMPGEFGQNWTCKLLPRASANQPEYRSAEDGKRAWVRAGPTRGP